MTSVLGLRSLALRRMLTPALNSRLISTSPKKSETAADVCDTVAKSRSEVAKSKNWVSYGFDWHDQANDENAMHSTFFLAITVCMVFCGFYMMYLPDYSMRDWSQREAFLELKRREDAGLPLIDPNLINPNKITLPSDEELGDTEIII